VVKQIYHVKKHYHKSRSSNQSSSNEKSNVATATTSADDGKDARQQVVDTQCVKYESMKLEVSKIKGKLPMPKSKLQLRCPLSLFNWQIKKLRKHSAEKLNGNTMAWVKNNVYKFRMGMIIRWKV
jgi:hypothetical protein